ncbi:MAG: hypothetical protein KDC71_14215 [Acidobacteria bacterium]|nr:hypothetical protein [Acidobacteriota bacterium]
MAIFCLMLLFSGDPDPSFGSNGFARFRFRTSTEFNDACLLPDGKIVIGGNDWASGGNKDLLIARLNANGTLDTSFGSNGRTFVDVDSEDIGLSLLRQNDGKLIVAGHSFENRVVMARFTENGQLDTTFGTNGKVKTKLSFYNLAAFHFVLQPDQKILAAGFFKLSEALEKTKMVMRFNANGSVDTSFGNGGVVALYGEDIDASAARLALGPDGMIYVGTIETLGGSEFFGIRRILPDGSDDFTVANLDLPGGIEHMTDLQLAHQGLLVTCNSPGSGTQTTLIAKVQFQGGLDLAFNGSGFIRFDSQTYNSSSAHAVNGGWIYSAGSAGAQNHRDYELRRVLANGHLDTSFGNQGYWNQDVAVPETFKKMLFQADGKLVVIGQTAETGFPSWLVGTVNRFLAPPEPFLSFSAWPQPQTILDFSGQINGVP